MIRMPGLINLPGGDVAVGENGDVDFSVRETKRLLKYAPIKGRHRFEAKLLVVNKWMHIARTDLLDDVCTSGVRVPWDKDDSEKHIRAYWICKVGYGARVREHKGRVSTFAVIDSVSDG
jgi:hypothetical protein